MTWDVPTAEDCPECGQTLFKKSGKGRMKPFCINEKCSRFLPEDLRGYYKKKTSENGVSAPEEKPAQIIDATGMVLMPGFINCHTHLPMQLLRGYADDLKLQEWLNDYIFPREDRLDGRCVRAATTLAVAECLKFGVTSVSDMYYFCDDICDVIAKSGMKANISRGTSMFL